jgi:hypothetical protein
VIRRRTAPGNSQGVDEAGAEPRRGTTAVLRQPSLSTAVRGAQRPSAPRGAGLLPVMQPTQADYTRTRWGCQVTLVSSRPASEHPLPERPLAYENPTRAEGDDSPRGSHSR